MKLYESKSNELKELMQEKAATNLWESLSSAEKAVVESVEGILSSSTLFIEDKQSSTALVLEYGVNTKVFESVAQVADGILESFICEDAEEEEEEAEEAEEKAAEERAEAEEEKAEEAEEKPEAEFENEEEKEATQEALINLIMAEELTIKHDLEESGLTINANSKYFSMIKESLLERLLDTCESQEELDVFESFIAKINEAELAESGLVVEMTRGKKEILKKVKSGDFLGAQKISDVLKKSKEAPVDKLAQKAKAVASGANPIDLLKAQSTGLKQGLAKGMKKGMLKGGLIGAGATLGAGALAMGAKKMYDRSKARKLAKAANESFLSEYLKEEGKSLADAGREAAKKKSEEIAKKAAEQAKKAPSKVRVITSKAVKSAKKAIGSASGKVDKTARSLGKAIVKHPVKAAAITAAIPATYAGGYYLKKKLDQKKANKAMESHKPTAKELVESI